MWKSRKVPSLAGVNHHKAKGWRMYEDGAMIIMSSEHHIFAIDPSTRLRPVAMDDAANLFAVVDANRAHLRIWLPWLDGCRSEADQLSFITSVVKRSEAGQGTVWLIEHERQICGVVGFNLIESCNRRCEIGYWLDHRHLGRGIMSRSVARIVRHAFLDLGLNRVSIAAADANQKSRAIPEGLGFRTEGVLRQVEWLYDHFVDHVLYAQLRSEWDEQQVHHESAAR